MRRRTLLAAAGTLAAGSLSGCMGATDAGQRPLAENPVGRGLDAQPRLGPSRSETGRTLVTFDNPNCGNCAAFHEEAFPRLRSEWAATGTATLYTRNAAVTSWAEAAVHALEEARRRSPDAYWTLKDAYFRNQDAVTEDTVAAKTRSFLSDANVDADAVARAAEERPHGDAVEADVAAWRDAGRLMFTPTTWIFEDGEFVATLGNEGFDAFRAAVETHD